MIRSFANKETERIWHRERSRKLPSEPQPVILRKLRQLNRVAQPAELRVPAGNRLA